MKTGFDSLKAALGAVHADRRVGRVADVDGRLVHVRGLSDVARLGDLVTIRTASDSLGGEIVILGENGASVLPDRTPDGLALGDKVLLEGAQELSPSAAWIGRVLDPFGQPMDGHPLLPGPVPRPLKADPPLATERRPLGSRLETGLTVFNTLLPIVAGQRIGLFAGSGVGKSTLLAQLAGGLEADVSVIALIGERGREVGEFVRDILGPEGMARSVVIAATSDRSPLVRRRCAWAAMAVAEYFRDEGANVLFLADSVTRFAEAHREIALAGGEAPAYMGFPASMPQQVMSLCERAGPGAGPQGNITAVFSVLVAGADMDGPVADCLRGVLDGHVVLDRDIAERGRFPAVNLLRSVSRSLPAAASPEENDLITRARRSLGLYDRSEMMITAGLYAAGTDPELDRAIRAWPLLDSFLGQTEEASSAESFERLQAILGPGPHPLPARTVPASVPSTDDDEVGS